ncbi:sushi, von Willebrand factor type A, EGF and pentraxin domain-containing protein 1-like [Gigantopelta aegis]|uniref:sushi, von Willebrand factor type A, EGF and pentraxin domain-containing protein 1-like n=1 Tax=Gigantopelta aegis TaxID=1735272 RepID=UPI001B889AB5|nr:sushi, von Willebrand factor type A, EGF and pentraxin domain-containing protein 1-like [Gigantopelta aegis]
MMGRKTCMVGVTLSYINCGEPPVVPNAIKSKNGTKFNSVANYSCDVGYVMSNGTMTSSTCESTGQWTAVIMSCTDINCGEPPVVPNAIKSKNGTKFNSVANYSCDVGYVMSNGTMTSSTCESTGQWTAVIMSCTDINCGEPPVVPNAIKSKNGTKFNSVANYSCDVGYVMSNGTMTSSTCESTGQWTAVIMSCTGKGIRLLLKGHS